MIWGSFTCILTHDKLELELTVHYTLNASKILVLLVFFTSIVKLTQRSQLRQVKP